MAFESVHLIFFVNIESDGAVYNLVSFDSQCIVCITTHQYLKSLGNLESFPPGITGLACCIRGRSVVIWNLFSPGITGLR